VIENANVISPTSNASPPCIYIHPLGSPFGCGFDHLSGLVEVCEQVVSTLMVGMLEKSAY